MNLTRPAKDAGAHAAIAAGFSARGANTAIQSLAYERFSEMGLPHRRLEGWRWSDFDAALRDYFPDPAAGSLAAPPLAADLAGLKSLEFHIENGWIQAPSGGAPEGVRFGIVDAEGVMPELESNAIASLNAAMARKALRIEIAKGVHFVQPILIRHVVSGGGFCFGQSLICLGEGARATIIESYEGGGAGFYSYLCRIALKDGAHIDRALIQELGDNTVLHALAAAKIEKSAHFNQASLSTGARLSRHETHLQFVAPDAAANIASAALVGGRRHNDFTSEIVHIGESCTTRQRHKGVATDNGRNVFQGKFRVVKGAQMTDARMNADALLLAEGAEANHKPELEIYADDVQCAHGSTAGALDANAIFYLRQRGLSEVAARALLIDAFVSGVFEGIEHPGVAQAFHHRIAKWLETA